MKRGFTLVELSIVLVVIGLLVGGILVAQSMISTSLITKQVIQFQQYDAAVANFKTKYSSLPGDTKFLTPQGNGNGYIESNITPYSDLFFIGEIANFWVHLNQSGFAPNYSFTANLGGGSMQAGPVIYNTPPVPLSKDAVVYAQIGYTPRCCNIDDQKVNYYILSKGSMLQYLTWYPAVAGADALALDQKMDNGNPDTGIVTANHNDGGPCRDASDTNYSTDSSALCMVMVKIMGGAT